MTRFLFALALASCGGQISDVDAGLDAAQTKDTAKPPHCDLVASDYSTACTAPTDCSPVFLGNACTSSCACENDVVAKSSLATYQADYKATTDGGGLVCPCPPPEPPSCCKGTCILGPCP
jgi:hypothetical protein